MGEGYEYTDEVVRDCKVLTLDETEFVDLKENSDLIFFILVILILALLKNFF